jgi:hypothetical protein
MNEVVPSAMRTPHPADDAPREISTTAEAEEALKTIAVAEAAEALWARAKDATKLFEAIRAKLLNQAAYLAAGCRQARRRPEIKVVEQRF